MKIRYIFLLFTTFFNCIFANNTEDNGELYSINYLRVENIYENGLVLKLDDGSIWDVHCYGGIWRLFGWGWSEQSDVSHWDIGDKIEIKYPGSGNFVDFVLIATNVPKVEKACVKLRQAPSPNCESCLWLFDYDEISKLITLNNGSKWVRTTADIYGSFFNQNTQPLSEWHPGDVVSLIGAEGWINSNTFFLWNHTTNEMPQVYKPE